MTMRVLVVDDNVLVLEAIRRVLAAQSYVVTTAYSVPIALELVETCEFDIVISDYEMPDMSGVRFLKRASEVHPSIPTVLITGNHDLPKPLGVSAVLRKPIAGPVLIDCIASLVGSTAPNDHA